MSTTPQIISTASQIAGNVASTATNVAGNLVTGVASGVSEIGKGASDLITDSSKGLGNVLSTSGDIVGKVGTNIGKTVYEVSNIPKNICAYNSVINIIIIIIFGSYLYKKMSVMTVDQNNIFVEGIITGIIISIFLWISMSSIKKNN